MSHRSEQKRTAASMESIHALITIDQFSNSGRPTTRGKQGITFNQYQLDQWEYGVRILSSWVTPPSMQYGACSWIITITKTALARRRAAITTIPRRFKRLYACRQYYNVRVVFRIA